MSGTEIVSHPFARIADDFVPRRFLRGGNVQTIAGNFLRRANKLPEPEERLFQIEDDVQILCDCHWQKERQKRLTLMIVHGLEGSSNSGYVIGTSNRAWAMGWNVVRMNVRGCGGTAHLSATLYHSGLSQDIEKLVSAMIARDKLEKVALAGFSMGGNQVLRTVGLWGAARPPVVIAAATVSPACDPSITADRLHKAAGSVYEWWFLRSLRRSFRRKSELWPGRYDPAFLKRVHSLRDFDEHITARYMGFTGAEDYYDKVASSNVLEKIALPTLVIHSDDDPFVVMSAESERKLNENPNVTFLHTQNGGHCAFLSGARNGDDGRWAERRVVEFLARVEEASA
ncbi:MAG: alpha/beta fold hydrolase [Candidatus Korobacteraceae bacterium]|jgi:predicted alpha/beta-fold hydrolase